MIPPRMASTGFFRSSASSSNRARCRGPPRPGCFLTKHPDRINDGWYVTNPNANQCRTCRLLSQWRLWILLCGRHSEIRKWLSSHVQYPAPPRAVLQLCGLQVLRCRRQGRFCLVSRADRLHQGRRWPGDVRLLRFSRTNSGKSILCNENDLFGPSGNPTFWSSLFAAQAGPRPGRRATLWLRSRRPRKSQCHCHHIDRS